VPDVLAYLRLCGLPEAAEVKRALEQFRYSMRVLIAPPWLGMFSRHRERKQNFAEAVKTYEVLVEVYEERLQTD
jgi:predicted ATPase